ncbi:MMPL family transporter [Nesterenkonia sp. MY13]|uniref:MMPL family transporter n=1 Tax=Nesterenkonia sedimenti TaxID=1463632 RepID=A0A7X8TIG7_9MICC|nr:MMPL family transporter [Nesterenkonia sedimenti]NLS09365.1 MMPL family transporter [Nesterenkonia sedimenti]
MARMLYRLGMLAARRAKTVIAGWFVLLLAAVAAFAGFGGQLTDQIDVPDLETTEVADRLADELPDAGGGSGTAVLRTDDGAEFTEEQQEQVDQLIADLESHEIVDEVTNPFDAQAEMDAGAEELAEAREMIDELPEDFDPAEAQAEIEAGREELEAGRAELEAAEEELAQGREQAEAGLSQMDISSDELPGLIEEVEAGLAELDAADAELDAEVQAAVNGGYWSQVEGELNAARAEIVSQRSTLEPQLAQLQQAQAGLAEIEAGEAEIEEGFAELEAAEAELEEGAAGLAEMEEATAGGEDPAEFIERNERLLALTEGAQMISEDGDVAILMIGFHDPLEQVEMNALSAVSDELLEAEIDGVEVLPGGDISFEMPHLFSIAEVIGLMVAAVVLLVMLGTFIGAGLPLLNALIGVGIGVAGAMALSDVVEMMSMTPILGLMLGLAVGIDYALFIINRHRRQLKDGMDMRESIALANGTAGNAVVFAGATVVIALLALNVTGLPFLGLMGTVGAFCVTIAVLMATTMTPALLKLVGWRILRRKERRYIGFSETAEEKVTTPMGSLKAVVLTVVSLAGLAVLAIPTFDLRLGLPDASSEAEDSTAYQAYVETEEGFGQGMNGPLVVLADYPQSFDSEAEATDYQLDVAEELVEHEYIDTVMPIALSEANDMAAYQVVPVDGPAAESTESLVHEFRDGNPLADTEVSDVELSVAGMTAAEIDISDVIADAMPLYLGLVVGLSLVLMVMVFRSILLPVIATLGFVGSLAGAIGVVVAVFQWGWLGDIFGVSRPGPIMTFLPILMVGILFGLAMDYQLFTASGMREAYAHGSPPRLAVRQGLHAGRAVVTAAALIMSSVFAGFIFTPDPMVASIGLGLAVGVLLDAFVVRLLLVPAVLHLCGPAAWWLPKWLDKILPDVDVEGAKLERSRAKDQEGAGI